LTKSRLYSGTNGLNASFINRERALASSHEDFLMIVPFSSPGLKLPERERERGNNKGRKGQEIRLNSMCKQSIVSE
jgi:hypothetical protein